jgi:hypothetical protein
VAFKGAPRKALLFFSDQMPGLGSLNYPLVSGSSARTHQWGKLLRHAVRMISLLFLIAALAANLGLCQLWRIRSQAVWRIRSAAALQITTRPATFFLAGVLDRANAGTEAPGQKWRLVSDRDRWAHSH